mgnify:CR=1 FL=1
MESITYRGKIMDFDKFDNNCAKKEVEDEATTHIISGMVCCTIACHKCHNDLNLPNFVVSAFQEVDIKIIDFGHVCLEVDAPKRDYKLTTEDERNTFMGQF